MKALVLCGGIPQIELINNLKSRGIITVLADMNENVGGRKYADVFYPVSTLDVDGIKNVAIQEKVDFIITICADQVLQVVAEVSEMLRLPCYIDFTTAKNVSKKTYMKKIFIENHIPTSKYLIMDEIDDNKINELCFPLIVKPVDSYSSRGVRKVQNATELYTAFSEAKKISRTHDAIVEEFVTGHELTVDVYVENGKAHILCISNIDKIPGADRFVICRTRCPADISSIVKEKISDAAQKIAEAFNLTNAPMLIQLITNGSDISIVEFCARTGGGDKFRLIKEVSGFDVVDAVVELTMGNNPHVSKERPRKKFVVDEFLYCYPGVLDHFEGFEELIRDGALTEFFLLKNSGSEFNEIKSSGDRAAYFTIESEDKTDLLRRHQLANKRLKIIDRNGNDILRHDLLSEYTGA